MLVVVEDPFSADLLHQVVRGGGRGRGACCGREHRIRAPESPRPPESLPGGGGRQAEAPMAPGGGREGGPDAPWADSGCRATFLKRPPFTRPLRSPPARPCLGRHDHAGGEGRGGRRCSRTDRPTSQGHASRHRPRSAGRPAARRAVRPGLHAGVAGSPGSHRRASAEKAAVRPAGGGGGRPADPGVAPKALDDQRGRPPPARRCPRSRRDPASGHARGGLERGDVGFPAGAEAGGPRPRGANGGPRIGRLGGERAVSSQTRVVRPSIWTLPFRASSRRLFDTDCEFLSGAVPLSRCRRPPTSASSPRPAAGRAPSSTSRWWWPPVTPRRPGGWPRTPSRRSRQPVCRAKMRIADLGPVAPGVIAGPLRAGDSLAEGGEPVDLRCGVEPPPA